MPFHFNRTVGVFNGKSIDEMIVWFIKPTIRKKSNISTWEAFEKRTSSDVDYVKAKKIFTIPSPTKEYIWKEICDYFETSSTEQWKKRESLMVLRKGYFLLEITLPFEEIKSDV